ncbi:Mitotic exit network regulator, forms GTPase-activating Bfa1p-Bub2p complex [Ogataea parapolymorpha DL-1]|uniref:Mitotic exit network regulator, forms GTPase-activating Bfa1p-Bub2p complex n=1 Tax=Ogataea parapolymorpha (strain ATCC 26012 / BCRC 20466 / JCM 22074 / NRRL Y-7560 / DL-1) TaxID=871575 RepID=W1QCD7_OGAPD|nr:Mitotic exit network regulator, forms GTPase-activating Bfa1p-Bub2p complex [Ogataea parapolymorpha DL-1]ESW97372.1 Mitotic exit network regulator, forms GTPase-activating Bfa1p-Bub2p complex [Ogataea parapolymorpha DL-1]
MKEKKGRRKDAIERFIESNQTVVLSSLNQLRYTILCEGLPKDNGLCPYRTYVWSILLRVEPLDVDYYANLVDRGPSNVFAKIQNDAFRTFQKDEEFSRKVSTSVLMRILNSHALEIESLELHNSAGAPASPYVQGMNILAAPFAYVCRSEVEAFALYSQLVSRYIPTYTTPNLLGVLNGVKLVDIILQLIDPKLYNFLKSKMLTAKIYALPSVLTLSACTPPLDQVLELWDFLFSYGVHLNIFFVVAQTILIRDELLKSANPMLLLRELPRLDARKIIKLSLTFVKQTPDQLYDIIVRHARENVEEEIASWESS